MFSPSLPPRPVCPPPPPLAAAHSMPSSVLRIHLQMKQIYHSVTQAGCGMPWHRLAGEGLRAPHSLCSSAAPSLTSSASFPFCGALEAPPPRRHRSPFSSPTCDRQLRAVTAGAVCSSGFQSRPNNTLLDNQIGDKLQDKRAA